MDLAHPSRTHWMVSFHTTSFTGNIGHGLLRVGVIDREQDC